MHVWSLVRIIPSSQLPPNWFRKAFKLLCPHQNRNVFQQRHIRHRQTREKKKKKSGISPRVVLQSHLCLCFICVLLGAILWVVDDAVLPPASPWGWVLGVRGPSASSIREPWCEAGHTYPRLGWERAGRHHQHPMQTALCAVPKRKLNTLSFLLTRKRFDFYNFPLARKPLLAQIAAFES